MHDKTFKAYFQAWLRRVTLSPFLGPDGMQDVCKLAFPRRPRAMQRKSFHEEQIAFALRQQEGGARMAEIIRMLGVTAQTCYSWT